MTSYTITPKQEAALARYTCCRLSTVPDREKLLRGFTSARGTALVNSLNSRGFISDFKGTIAYYIVKDPDGNAAFFFSLRCGLLCEPGYIRRIMGLLDETELLQMALEGAARGESYWQGILEREKKRLGAAEFEDRVENLKDLRKKKTSILQDAEEDAAILPHQDVVRVDETHAAVELVEMCVNDAARACWDRLGLGSRGLGTTMFWHFVVPKMQELSAVAGCEYAYLFAADEPDGTLVHYYKHTLHFIEPRNLGSIKPSYDTKCLLLCKKLFTGKPGLTGPLGLREYDPDPHGLDRHMQMFFDTFNAPQLP